MGLTTMKVAALEVCDRVRVRYQTPKAASDVVQEYADAYRCGLLTEPLDVFREKGTQRFIVADGENRLLALRAAKIDEVDVRLHEGDEVAALDFAIGCNHSHGLRRNKADKYHAFQRIMETPTLRSKYRTDTELADKVGIAIRTVSDYKVQWRNSDDGDKKVRAAKEKSRTVADKRSVNGHARTELVVKPKREPAAKPTTTEQKKVAAQVRDSAKPKAEISTADLHDLKRAVATLASTKVDPAAAAGKLDAANVQRAADFLWKLMEKNS